MNVNQPNQGKIVRYLLLILAVASLFLLNGCDLAQLTEDPEVATNDVDNSSGQEVASAPGDEEPSGTLPPPVIFEATHTPAPATNTPEATTTPKMTATSEPTDIPSTETPEPIPPTNTPQPAQPTNPPPPPPTETPEPTLPPPPPIGANGLAASHFALQDRSEYTAGGSVWFEFTVANSTGGEVPYNALGVMPKRDGVDHFEWYQQSYGGRNSKIKPAGFSWEDHIKLPEPGNYSLRLVMCFDGFDNCLQGKGAWKTMSQEIEVQIN